MRHSEHINKVCVLGLGYIGLPTAALLASRGLEVHGVDIKESVVKTINEGKVHIVEPELDMLVMAATKTGKLVASTQPAEADVFIIAVPTPLVNEEGPRPLPCIDFVLKAARSIAPLVRPGNLVILESTSPVGTTRKVQEILNENTNLEGVFIAYCPERVLPGRVISELVENDRVVGGVNTASTRRAKEFYDHFVQGTIHQSDCETAELVKLSENAYRDVNIAFANELSIIAEDCNVNPYKLISLANCHPRVNILEPGW